MWEVNWSYYLQCFSNSPLCNSPCCVLVSTPPAPTLQGYGGVVQEGQGIENAGGAESNEFQRAAVEVESMAIMVAKTLGLYRDYIGFIEV